MLDQHKGEPLLQVENGTSQKQRERAEQPGQSPYVAIRDWLTTKGISGLVVLIHRCRSTLGPLMPVYHFLISHF
jgi:hypothetical protein